MKLNEGIREQLQSPISPSAIKQHPTKSYLSTIKAIYIVERLNDVFGICGWNLEHEIVVDTPEYVTMKGRIVIYMGDSESDYSYTPYQYGGHKKTGTNTEAADGYKSAVTDCQSKCASYLEIGIDIFKGLGVVPIKLSDEEKTVLIDLAGKISEEKKTAISKMIESTDINKGNFNVSKIKLNRLITEKNNEV